MTASELRIGNWIMRDSQPDGFVVDAQTISRLSHSVVRDEKPIPLTEEWLERFGFEKVSSHFEIGEDIRRYALYINSGGNGFTCQLLRTFSGVHTITNFATDMLNVHQLQNLFYALTGKELTIKH